MKQVMGWNRKYLSLDLANYENLIVQVFSPLFLLAQVKRVDYKVDNMEGYAQWSLTRSCETVKYKKKKKWKINLYPGVPALLRHNGRANKGWSQSSFTANLTNFLQHQIYNASHHIIKAWKKRYLRKVVSGLKGDLLRIMLPFKILKIFLKACFQMF